MAAQSDPKLTRTFLEIACSQALLTPEAAEEVLREVESKGQPVTEVVLRKGVLDPMQVDMIDTLAQPGQAFPGYEILGIIGRGGMGMVYRARQKNLNREVAIKTLLVGGSSLAAAISRLEKEAVTVASLRHPNIVTAYDFGRLAGRLYFVMELLEGEDLDNRITRQGSIDEPTAWQIARQAARGLAHASERGIVHRDVKPANLFLVKPPEGFALPAGVPMVKVTDFGLVLSLGDAESMRLTKAGTSLGTPTYMAPEQFSDPHVDLRADIYALGATVYHMLAGQPPFDGDSTWKVMSAKMQGELTELDRIASPASAQLLRDMLAVDPNRRIGEYSTLMARMEEVLGEQAFSTAATRSLPNVTVPAISHRPRARRVAAGAGILVAVGAVLATAWLVARPRQAELAVVGSAPLFDGSSLAPWQPQEGTWTVSSDPEGGPVLAGRGVAKRALRQVPNFVVSMGVDLHEAQAVEVQFGVQEDGERYVLRYDHSGAEFGERKGDSGELRALGRRVSLIARGSDVSPYVELRVERRNSTWLAYCDNQLVGSAQKQAVDSRAEILLAALGGTAYFESLEQITLGTKSPETGPPHAP
jgi:eukaryotic-like serine/threonine-protein kinase